MLWKSLLVICLSLCVFVSAQDSLPVTDGYVLMPDRSQQVMPAWMKNLYQQYNPKYFMAETNSGHFGIVDKELKLVCDTIFRNFCQEIDYWSGNKRKTFCFRQLAVQGKTMYDFEGDWIMTDEEGRPINDLKFFKPWNFINSLEFYDHGIWIANSEGKWGYLTNKFKWEIEPRFDTLWQLQWDTGTADRTRMVVKENGLYGVIDSAKMVIPCIYNKVIYAFGGYTPVFVSATDTIMYNPDEHTIIPFSISKLDKIQWGCYACQNNPEIYYFSDAYKVRYERTALLFNMCAYKQRFEHGGVFSPELYDPGDMISSWWNRDERFAYCLPNYAPAPPFTPWFKLIAASCDSDYFSYCSTYTMLDPTNDDNWNSFYWRSLGTYGFSAYWFKDKDTMTYVNYRVTEKGTYPLTIQMLFRKDIDVGKEFLKIANDMAKKYRTDLPEGEWELTSDYFIVSGGVVAVFESKIKDDQGRTQRMHIYGTWYQLSPLLDLNGVVGDRFRSKK